MLEKQAFLAPFGFKYLSISTYPEKTENFDL